MTRSEMMKKRWKENISYRQMMISGNTTRWTDPEYAKRVSQKMSNIRIELMTNPIERKKCSDATKKVWKDRPETFATFLKNGHSKESIEKMRKTKTGKKQSDSHRAAIKKGALIAGAAGRLTRYSKTNLPPNLKLAQSKSPFQKGEKNLRWNPNYQDSYGYEFTRNLKKEILKRDNNKCRNCFSSKKVVIHHIDENKYNNFKNNLITLCRTCHMKIHHKSIELHNIVAVPKLGCMLEQPERRSPQGLAQTVNQQATCKSRETSETTRQDLILR